MSALFISMVFLLGVSSIKGQISECEEAGGSCIFMAAALACPPMSQFLMCNRNIDMCCNLHGRSLESREAAQVKRSDCTAAGGDCLPVMSAIHCPKTLSATCGSSSLYCCQLHQESLTEEVVPGPAQPLPTCHSQDGGQCLSVYSRIFCHEKLEATCEGPNMYCCRMG